MANRFKNNLYTTGIYTYKDHHFNYVKSDDGTLYSGTHRTKIRAEDLPEWYVYGRFYKKWGYMSTKGIADMLYIPDKFSNHFLKDDCLLISYGGKIVEAHPEKSFSLDRYEGYDECVWGNEIVDILKGAKIYSDYDISDFISKLKEKKDWLANNYPEEFVQQRWHFDVDAYFAEEFENGRPQRKPTS